MYNELVYYQDKDKSDMLANEFVKLFNKPAGNNKQIIVNTINNTLSDIKIDCKFQNI